MQFFHDKASLAEAVLSRLKLTNTRPLKVAIAGGSLIPFFFDYIFPTLNVEGIWWVDERLVPVESEHSNYGTALRMYESKIENFRLLCHQLSTKTKLPDALDFVLMGLGEDGHFASAFPKTNSLNLLKTSERNLEIINDSPKFPPDRITMTPHYLKTKCDTILFIVFGESKKHAVSEVIGGKGLTCELLPDAEWYVDESATPCRAE